MRQKLARQFMWLFVAFIGVVLWRGLACSAQLSAAASTAIFTRPVQTQKPESRVAKGATKKNATKTISINVKVGKQSFPAQLFDNETSRALMEKMPLTVNMSDLHQNEKYHRFDDPLPAANTVKPAKIKAGEIMCWLSDTLVLFYDSFDNAYGGYVKLGYIEDVSKLAKALGKGDVKISFERE